MVHLANLRRDYLLAGLDAADLARDPVRQFERWFADAAAARVPEVNAMVLTTATRGGRPGARTVLLKGVDRRGFVFYSNYESRKGRELRANPRATLLFPWWTLERQVIIEGRVVRMARRESVRYFHRRPRTHQLAAWASAQSRPIASRAVLEAAMRGAERRFAGRAVPLPPCWGGYRLAPETVEFWQGRRSRLHDRLRYCRTPGGGWRIERLSP
ncbi:MAG TPA: pyridoxamine 5'-phosphate oxidase [Opitutaceae bacterium]|nr:pyridoxamine 5'-phosphate oxidase [Opitutaceae bacterium]